ncbi:MAG: DUF3105 domain-containing protein [Dehalococcoidia bacterium]|nr:DUF3105 domain-containing protein [Dehalococcoidia bacterium]
MSREQRRVDRKSQRGGATPPSSHKTPVKAGGSGPPWTPILAALGAVAVVGMLVFLISQRGNGATMSEAAKAAANQSSSIPGTFVPDQGQSHLSAPFSLASLQPPIPFCPGVPYNTKYDPVAARQKLAANGASPAAGTATASATSTPTQTPTATPTRTPAPTGTTAAGSPTRGTPTANVTPTVSTECYLSNPPSSGPMLGDQQQVDIGNNAQIELPPGYSVYPPDVEIPRDSISHLLEHAGVFVGWNCAQGDQACADVVKQLEKVVNNRIDVKRNRVVMAHDNDLIAGTIGMSAWTRVLNFNYKDYKKQTVTDFIGTNSCRVDWEGSCN